MYGTLVGKIAVTCEDGKQVLVDWINPFALITHACAASLGFFRTMQAAMQHAHQEHGGQLRFVLYHDGVTPGNNLRLSFPSFGAGLTCLCGCGVERDCAG